MNKRHYVVLDGLRGIAAVAVMVYHLTGVQDSPIQHGYLAVDFFFALSGFVIADAYQQRLSSGDLSVRRFLLLRAIRLWPMVALGALCGAAFLTVQSLHHGSPSLPLILGLTVAGVVMAPVALHGDKLDSAYPLNPATWSLLYEVGVNALFAAIAPRLTTRALVCCLALSGVALTLTAMSAGTLDQGHALSEAGGALARVCFSFTAGVLIWRKRPSVRLPLPVICAALLAALVMPTPDFRAAFDLGAVLILFPVLIAGAANAEPSRPALMVLAGKISYPLYALHQALLPALHNLDYRLGLAPDSHWLGLSDSVVILILAYVALRFYDEPMRKALGRMARGGSLWSTPGVVAHFRHAGRGDGPKAAGRTAD